MMAILTTTILLSKWNSVWIYLTRRLMDSKEPYFSLTMPLHTKSVRQMHPVLQAVLDERGLFRYKENGKGMNGECKDFKCPDGATDCCCRCILFNQLDFVGVKSHLEEVINSCGHLCDFYPKFHCKLNYIKQYWGAVKLLYRSGPWLKKMEDMEKQVVACLGDISLMQIQR